MEGTMAVVTTVAYDFTPRYWAACNGQLLAINTNAALFSLLGTTYGGNGTTNFGLPDLRGRVPISTGSGPGLSNRILGESGGTENVTMLNSNMPAHNHNGAVSLAIAASSTAGFDNIAEANNIGSGMSNTFSTNADTNLATPTYQPTIGISGGNTPFSVLSPYLTLNYVICMQGIFPSRN